MVKNNYREDGFIWFDDQISEMADLLLNVKGVAQTYKKKKGHCWIRRIKDKGLRSALKRMNRIQIKMIEELVFEGKTIPDIQIETGLSVTEICIETRKMRKLLLEEM